jgi:hypothetical protein
MEYTVFSGFVTACRLAVCPTRISPLLVKPTTEGVVRMPSEFSMTLGSPPSMIDTQELVVPKSIPITLAIGTPFLTFQPNFTKFLFKLKYYCKKGSKSMK